MQQRSPDGPTSSENPVSQTYVKAIANILHQSVGFVVPENSTNCAVYIQRGKTKLNLKDKNLWL